jgi:hypothetical protein
MVGVKITVKNYGQNKLYFCHFFSCWFLLDKNIEIGNNEWHGAPFGEIETEPRNLRI